MRIRPLLALVALTLALSGCVTQTSPDPETPTPWPPQTTAAETPSPTPTLSDAEAAELVAATHRKFLLTVTDVVVEGADPEDRLGQITTSNMSDVVAQIVSYAATDEFAGGGEVRTWNESLVSRTVIDGQDAFVATLCVDVSDVVVTDSTGERVQQGPNASADSSMVTVVMSPTGPRIHADEDPAGEVACE